MIYYTNDCCGCATESYPCLGSGCSRRHVAHFQCDDCHDEFEEGELYDVDGEHLCQRCLEDRFPRVYEKE